MYDILFVKFEITIVEEIGFSHSIINVFPVQLNTFYNFIRI